MQPYQPYAIICPKSYYVHLDTSNSGTRV